MPASARKSIADSELDLRNSMWPDADKRLWHRKEYGGFTTIPKTMPLLGRMMDEMTKNYPVSQTYNALWAWTWDNSFVRLGKLDEIAFAAGFTGQRGVRTLQDRLKRLEALGFVELKAAGMSKMAFAFLPNPHSVIFELHDALSDAAAPAEKKQLASGLQEATFNAFLARAQELGCKDVKAMIVARSAKTTANSSSVTTSVATKRPRRVTVRRKSKP